MKEKKSELNKRKDQIESQFYHLAKGLLRSKVINEKGKFDILTIISREY